ENTKVVVCRKLAQWPHQPHACAAGQKRAEWTDTMQGQATVTNASPHNGTETSKQQYMQDIVGACPGTDSCQQFNISVAQCIVLAPPQPRPTHGRRHSIADNHPGKGRCKRFSTMHPGKSQARPHDRLRQGVWQETGTDINASQP